MNRRLVGKSIFWLWLALPWGFALGTEAGQADRWAEELAASLPPGQIQRLGAEGDEFLAIYTEQLKPTPAGAVILLHDTGAHPDWPEVISPLRRELPDHGWSTLALHIPAAADPDTLASRAAEHIRAGAEFLRAQDARNIVLAGHGLGAVMAASYLASIEDHGIKALVAIGIGAPVVDSSLEVPPLLAKIKVPVFDVYGSRDLPEVTSTAKLRTAAAAKAGNGSYRQAEILGADHFFIGLSDILVKRIYSWLHRHAQATEKQSESTEEENPA